MTGDDLRAHRVERGLSRRALAALADLHPDTVKYWERKPTVDLRGHAPDRLLRALHAGHLSLRGVYPCVEPRGIFGTGTRARGGVLQFAAISAAPSRGPTSCGARTRKGTACKASPLPGKKRCKFHGGMSTGPRTPEGKERIADAQRQRWSRRSKTAAQDLRSESLEAAQTWRLCSMPGSGRRSELSDARRSATLRGNRARPSA
ncbi:helix-turn-helix domain-containing protein [Meridianimarinicoccus aquatilis]|uniref:XRE family transcriptional regulator n=1 Tax=Meridianimarinicoccus aquatilis TaxID=2552766 RepID=A0A4R6AWF9_9RHOB|nr:helix-turn-helix transcriptional regulator [Fluviibacterium aquatile]TDL88025.1 XRE family transcriptional regulator [Fluviibacterium aquatile]